MESVIIVQDVSMMFNIASEKVDSLKEFFIKSVKGTLRFQEFWALQDISFSVKRGENFGIIGVNGSGKSTLLKIIAGVLGPTNGTAKVQGSIAPMIELGAGFDMELSAKENIFLNGAILGYSRKEMEKKYQYIIDFSELHDFQELQIKNFSSGMIARLGFAIATSSIPDVLIVDEILSVGDVAFQQKCHNRITEMQREGTTMLFVSHSLDQVKDLCDRVLWLDKGKIIEIGDATQVVDHFIEHVQN